MGLPITVIDHANDLIEKHGKEYAIADFKKKIEELGKPKNFMEVCKLSGYKTAIEYINGKFDKKS